MPTRTLPAMRWRPLLLITLALAAGAAQAGVIEDLFRGLIEERKRVQNWLPQGVLPQMAHELSKPEISERKDGLELGREQYAIFVAPRCRTCDVAVARLKQRGFQVEVLDLATSKTAREAFELSGAKGVPTVLAGKRMLGGWSDKHFDRLLKSDIQDKIQQQQGTGA
jgi:glutaredoxin